jgi:hypothetical protein
MNEISLLIGMSDLFSARPSVPTLPAVSVSYSRS